MLCKGDSSGARPLWGGASAPLWGANLKPHAMRADIYFQLKFLHRRRTMKKAAIMQVVCFIASFSLGWNANAQMPKERRFDITNTYAGTHKVFPIDKDHYVIYFENTGVVVSNSGEGPFHKVGSHNMGIMYFEKGVLRLTSYFSITDKDGDKVLWMFTETGSKPSPPNPVNGTGKIIWGTGKFTGIQGTMEYTRQNVRPAADGTHQAIATAKGTWKLP
jgi:hypothetical protein